MSCCLVHGALYSGIMQQLPRTSLCFKTQEFSRITLGLGGGGGVQGFRKGRPLDNNAQVCEFGEINTQKSKNCSISPLYGVPREREYYLFPNTKPSHEELPGKMFSRMLNHKTLSDAQNTSTLRLASQNAAFSHC